MVKWLLAIPHFVILAFLWIAFAVLSVAAFVSILVTSRYPRAIFDFNVGVLRWHWRVAYYSYAAFGTDRYLPFTLAEVPDYPAHLEIAYPERLSRGLVLVKWWLLAIPHYLVTGLFIGGGFWLGTHHRDGVGLVGILALVAAVLVTFTGRYPKPLFDFILGMDRWVLRVASYAGLMTDKYPPFRLDMGGDDPAGTLTVPPPSPPPKAGWTAGRVISVIAGATLAMGSLGLFAGGAVGLWADQTQRQDGYLTTGVTSYHTDGYAMATGTMELWSSDNFVGDVRIRVTAADRATPVFVGIAPADAVDAYLSDVGYSTVSGLSNRDIRYVEHIGKAPGTLPGEVGIWAAQASGPGTQTLTWAARDGRWVIVVMNADSTAPVTARADAGATVPALSWIIASLFVAGALALTAAVALIAIPLNRMRRVP